MSAEEWGTTQILAEGDHGLVGSRTCRRAGGVEGQTRGVGVADNGRSGNVGAAGSGRADLREADKWMIGEVGMSERWGVEGRTRGIRQADGWTRGVGLAADRESGSVGAADSGRADPREHQEGGESKDGPTGLDKQTDGPVGLDWRTIREAGASGQQIVEERTRRNVRKVESRRTDPQDYKHMDGPAGGGRAHDWTRRVGKWTCGKVGVIMGPGASADRCQMDRGHYTASSSLSTSV
jgi:hypothetical protein